MGGPSDHSCGEWYGGGLVVGRTSSWVKSSEWGLKKETIQEWLQCEAFLPQSSLFLLSSSLTTTTTLTFGSAVSFEALASATLLSSLHGCIAMPSPGPVAAGQPGLTIPLTRRAPPVRTVDDWAAWTHSERTGLPQSQVWQ